MGHGVYLHHTTNTPHGAALMNDLIALIESKLSVQGTKIRFDGTFYHFYADSENVIAELTEAAALIVKELG